MTRPASSGRISWARSRSNQGSHAEEKGSHTGGHRLPKYAGSLLLCDSSVAFPQISAPRSVDSDREEASGRKRFPQRSRDEGMGDA